MNTKLDFDISELELDEPRFNSDGPACTRREFWEALWHVMTEFLQPSGEAMSVDEAVDRAAVFWNYADEGAIAVHLVVLTLAGQIPYDHPAQRGLAEFVYAFAASEKWDSRPGVHHPDTAEDYFWSKLCVYFHEYNFTPDDCAEDGDDPTPYANHATFVANMMIPGQTSKHILYKCARWALDTLLKDRSRSTPAARDAWVIGAAQYILLQGRLVLEEVSKPLEMQPEAQIRLERHLFSCWRSRKQKPQLVRERFFDWAKWDAWKSALRAVATNDLYGERCRDVAGRAADMMTVHEQSAVKGRDGEPSP